MKAILLCVIVPVMASATALTGVINGPDGKGVNGRLYMSLSMQGALSTAGTCGGPVQVTPTYRVTITLINGALQPPAIVYGNDCMLPANLYYKVQLQDNNGNILFNDNWIITGASINVGTIVSAITDGNTTLGSTGFAMLTPLGNQVINQPGNTTFSVNSLATTGVLTLPDGSQCTTSGCITNNSNTVTLDTDQTIAGQKTFAKTLLGTSGASLGTYANPFTELWTTQQVLSNAVRIYQGAPTANLVNNDFFVWEFPPIGGLQHQMAIVDSSAKEIMFYNAATGAPLTGNKVRNPGDRDIGYPNSYWQFTGAVRPDGDSTYDLGASDTFWRYAYEVFTFIRGGLFIGVPNVTPNESNFFDRTFSGGDANCVPGTTGRAGSIQIKGVPRDITNYDGWMGIRLDTHEIQVCMGGQLFKLTMQ